MQILLTGGTGLIGRHLIPPLIETGHSITVVTRSPERARQLLDPRVTLWQSLDEHHSLDGFDAVINLAGEPIADKRWSAAQKQRLCQSRWRITQRLVEMIHGSNQPPAIFLSGSAVGFYGDTGDEVITEEDTPHNEFTHELCAKWEAIALQAQSPHTRVCLLRTGVVLAPDGGMLSKLLPLFRLGLGGPLGDGRQYLSWIHIEDMVNAILWLLDNPLQGPFNMVAPYPVRNARFTQLLGEAVKRPAILRVPARVISLMMGESATLVLGGQNVLPRRLEQSGFGFRWFQLEDALHNVT
ncbi:TIGR01777 family protein [Mangrovibacter phragmitis]|uniref:TIGR01777 family protein n=1 Tax=Mangrovibacter phragmitis TaxID=1691903 RepID=A0A1B7L9S5_9ENTR|nr:TIGR01777 family oxidoreductase [Mangrovibacter phragmitis]OAT79083.1 TIGR01777 family protein [Mangrovibacter phragmitis]